MKLLQFGVLSALAIVSFCMPLEDFSVVTTAKAIPHASSQLPATYGINNQPTNNQGLPTTQTTVMNNNNKQGVQHNVSYGYLQTVRKEWKCVDGKCQETVTKCKNGQCDSSENKFKADHYPPELPQIESIQFPEFNFAEFFKSFKKFDFPSPINFDNTGLVDMVLDTKNFDYYFTNAKFINSKCIDRVCEVKTRTCTNGKCNEEVSKQNF